MNVSSDNQRRSERQQTFYAAYAYTCRDGEWCRLDVKVFDQSGQGVRLRSMQNLEGDKLYLQLDPTNPVLIDCSIRRSQPVARNCWEFGLELDELAEMRDVLPKHVLEAYGVKSVKLSSQPHQFTEDVGVEAVDLGGTAASQLDDLLNNTLGLSDLPTLEPEPAPEPVVATEPAVRNEPVVSTNPVVSTAPAETAPVVSMEPIPAPQEVAATEQVPTAVAATVLPTLPPELPDQPIAAVNSEFTQAADSPGPALPMPGMVTKKAGFLETVMVGFAGLASVVCEFAVKCAKTLRFIIGANVPAGSFFSNTTEEAQRLEWLQACSKNISVDRTGGLNWTEDSGTGPE